MNFSIILSSIFVPACVTLLFHIIHATTYKASSKKVAKDQFTVCVPNICAVIGALTAIVFGVFILSSPIIWSNESGYSMIAFYVIFGVFFWLGIYLIIKTIRFRIVVEKNKITVYPLFSRAYTVTFEDINTVIRQTKKQHKGLAERIVISTKQGKKIIAEHTFVAYFKLVDKIQNCVDSSKLKGFERQSGDGSTGDGTVCD